MTKIMNLGSTIHFEPGSLQETIFDIIMGFITGVSHFFTFLERWFIERPFEIVTGKKLFDKKSKDGLKVVGIGFGRTGTYSLSLALEELGYPTLHTQHLYENEEIFKMWTDTVFQKSIDEGHASLFEPDFDVISDHGFQATMDFPTALYYDQILQRYPDCKFILTTRERSEVWFKSWDSLAKSITPAANLGGIFVSGVRRYSIYLRWLYAIINEDDTFLVSEEARNEQNHDKAIQRYEEHNRRVREIIPPDRLLEYSVRDGWNPLCEFLDVPRCPTTPFPKTNSARSVQVQSVSSYMFPLLMILYCLSKVFRMITGRTVVQHINLQTNLLQNRLRKTVIGNPVEKDIV